MFPVVSGDPALAAQFVEHPLEQVQILGFEYPTVTFQRHRQPLNAAQCLTISHKDFDAKASHGDWADVRPLMSRRRWPMNVLEQEKADLLHCRHIRVSRQNGAFTTDAAEHRDQHEAVIPKLAYGGDREIVVG
ncbi:hypothetical protein [Mesorhizobium sp. L2C066B000]|uniref:hypothetical protein n=1 Tax=Mesorhizobium sp. L2C066B000 TaxID=1287105 RepID=UPI0012DDF3EB|nr:hypothetical protein [Mesorhizobium sp. L2C066B000]